MLPNGYNCTKGYTRKAEMSRTITIETKSEISFRQLGEFLRNIDEDIVAIDRSYGIVYYYVKGKSTRGIDVSKEKDGYEIRRTTLANRADYQLANTVVAFFNDHAAQPALLLEDEPFDRYPVWTTEEQQALFKRDAKFIYQLSVEKDKAPITLYAADQEYNLGAYTFAKVKAGEPDWEDRLQQLILRVLYHLPEIKETSVLRIRKNKDDEGRIMKFVDPETSYILRKYDGLLFMKGKDSSGAGSLELTNDLLNEHLPP